MYQRNGASIRNIAEVRWETPPAHYDAHSTSHPGVELAIYNSGLRDLTFLVITSPPSDA